MPVPVDPEKAVSLDEEESATVCSLGCAADRSLLAAGGTEAFGSAGSLGEGVGFGKDGLDALDDTELGDAMAGGDGLGFGGEIGENDFKLAAVAGINDAGEGGEAAQGETGAVFNQSAVSFGQFEGEPGGDCAGRAGFADRREHGGLRGEEIGGEVAIRSHVGVARQLRGRVKALDEDRGLRAGVRHGVRKIVARRQGRAVS